MTTIELSTSIPTPNASPPSVITFNEKPEKYISSVQPHIRDNEFRVLKRIDEYRVAKRLQGYIAEYKKAKQNQKLPRNRMLVKYSTLQYFEKYL